MRPARGPLPGLCAGGLRGQSGDRVGLVRGAAGKGKAGRNLLFPFPKPFDKQPPPSQIVRMWRNW